MAPFLIIREMHFFMEFPDLPLHNNKETILVDWRCIISKERMFLVMFHIFDNLLTHIIIDWRGVYPYADNLFKLFKVAFIKNFKTFYCLFYEVAEGFIGLFDELTNSCWPDSP